MDIKWKTLKERASIVKEIVKGVSIKGKRVQKNRFLIFCLEVRFTIELTPQALTSAEGAIIAVS